MTEKKRQSNKALVARIHDISGFNRNDSQLAFRATIAAISEILLEGKPVTLHGLGQFWFKTRKGRAMPAKVLNTARAGKILVPAHVQEDSVILKFTGSGKFLAEMKKNIKPTTYVKKDSV